ncbi:class I mannose-6-phosphate isomerase [Nocardioides pakistanensis]
MSLSPVLLDVNTPQRFYRGGRKILHFRGLPEGADFDGRRPEDWLASTTHLFAEGGDGLTFLPEGVTLTAELDQHPDAWLGAQHVARHGSEPGLLVKLLDAAERLPVHVHPDRAFATRHLHCPNGKTEAWLVLDADPGSSVWLGFREDLAEERLTAMVDTQDEQLLEVLNEFPVRRGDTVLVPAGQPHAIGAGVFAVELQEPTDFSVMLEHARFGLDPNQSWLGLDRALALTSVDRSALSPDGLSALRGRWEDLGRPVASVLPAAADPFFRAEVLDGQLDDARSDAGFSVVVVVAGTGRLLTENGHDIHLEAGQTLLTPYSCGELTLTGQVTAIRCRPGQDNPHTSGAAAPASTTQQLEERP